MVGLPLWLPCGRPHTCKKQVGRQDLPLRRRTDRSAVAGVDKEPVGRGHRPFSAGFWSSGEPRSRNAENGSAPPSVCLHERWPAASLQPISRESPMSSRSTSSPLSWWGDRGVKVKVLTAVGAAAVVAAGVGVMGLTALSTSADTTHTLYASNLAGVSAVGDMNVVIGEVRKSSRDALITPDRAEAQQILDALPRYADDYHAAVDAYAASFPTPEKQELVDRATAAFDQYMQLAQGELGPLAIA